MGSSDSALRTAAVRRGDSTEHSVALSGDRALALQPRDAKRIYVTVPGTLLRAVAEGEPVTAGQTLAKLENLDVTLEVAQLTGQRDTQRLHLATLQSRQGDDPAAAAEIPTAKEALADTEDRLARRNEDLARLTLTAPQAGTVLPPPRLPDHTAGPTADLVRLAAGRAQPRRSTWKPARLFASSAIRDRWKPWP